MPAHTLITVLAIAFASLTVLQLTKEQPAQAATGIFAEFPFQGRLTNSDGTVVANANYDAVFQLYTVNIGGTAVWSESHTGGSQLATVDGIFNTMLGSITSLAGIDFNQDEYWLGITVGVDAEMTPRIRLGAAPYAFNTDKLDGVSAENFLQLPGQAGGQTAFGGIAASENLVLRSTSNATKGNVIIADDGGLVGVGTTSPAGNLHVQGLDNSNADLILRTSATVAATGPALRLDRTRGTAISPTIVSLGDQLGAITGRGYDGSVFQNAASILFGVDATPGAGDMPGNITLQTALDGSVTQVGRLTVTNAGNVVVGSTGGSALATTATDGFLYTPTMAGVPTGVPSSYTGRSPLAFNTSSNILYLYNGGWQAINGGSGVTGSGVAGRVTIWSGASAVTSDAEYLYDSTNNRLSIGTTPSIDTAAVINIPNNKYISARNAANTGNIALIRLDASDSIQLGPTSGVDTTITTVSSPGIPNFIFENPGTGVVSTLLEGSLSVYNSNGFGSTPATTGNIRLPNSASINAKKIAGGDASLISLNSSDQIQFGPTSGVDTTIATASSPGIPNFMLMNPGTGVANTLLEGSLLVYNSDGMVGGIATLGVIRVGNNAALVGRDSTNTLNINLIKVGTNNQLVLGPTSGSDQVTFDVLPSSGRGNYTFNSSSAQIADVSIEGALNVYNTNGMSGGIASIGAIRLENNSAIVARNSTNTGDISLIKLGASDQIVLGPTSGSNDVRFDVTPGAGRGNYIFNSSTAQIADVSVEGALNVYNTNGLTGGIANTGVINLKNNASISARNAGDSSDISLIKLGTSDQIVLGPTSGSNDVRFDVTPGAGRGNYIFNSSTAQIADVSVEGALNVYNTNGLTGGIANTGVINLKNNASISARNAADTADISLIKLNTSNLIEFGAGLNLSGSLIPTADDTYDLGSSSFRWRDLYLGPTSLHLTTTVAETATARDWKLSVDETNGATDGDLRIQEGSNSYFGVTTAGNIVLGTAALATTATNGFLYTPSMAGVPTGVPTTYTGRVPYTYDSTTNALYAYNGGAWQQLTSMSGGAVVLSEVSAPSATANQGKLYVQSIVGGNSIFFKDENGVATDLVNDKLGTSEKLRTVRGNINPDGTIAQGSGFTSVRNGTGSYTITFSTAFSSMPTVAVSATNGGFLRASISTSTSFNVDVASDSSISTPADNNFSFIVVGTP